MSNPVVDICGDKRWYNEDNKLHREDGPAIEWVDGSKEWWVNGERHRLDGPAIEWVDGSREWYINGEFHRLDGPACEWSDGDKEWWIEGKKYTEEEFNEYINHLDTQEIDNGSKYVRNIKGVSVDIYDIATAFNLDCARYHAIKKILCAGNRGYKDFEKDLNEAKFSLNRSLELQNTEQLWRR